MEMTGVGENFRIVSEGLREVALRRSLSYMISSSPIARLCRVGDLFALEYDSDSIFGVACFSNSFTIIASYVLCHVPDLVAASALRVCDTACGQQGRRRL